MIKFIFLAIAMPFCFFISAQVNSPVAPSRGFTGIAPLVSFEWNENPAADFYQLQLSVSPIFSGAASYNVHQPDTFFSVAPAHYFWRVRSSSGGVFSAWSVSSDFYRISLPALGTMSYWLRADTAVVTDGGGNVLEWRDVSGSGYHFTPLIPAFRPSLAPAQLNGLPAIYFDGNEQLSNFNPVGIASEFTIYIRENIGSVIVSGLYAASANPRIGFSVEPNEMMTTNPNSNYYYGQLFVNKGSNYSVPINEWQLLSGVAPVNNYTDYSLSPSHSGYGRLQGNIPETFAYSTQLSPANRNLAEDYLRFKYAPPVNLGRDVMESYSLCPQNLSAGGTYTTYLWSTGATTPSISVNQNGIYWLEATDVFGLISRDTVLVQLNSPVPFNDTLICLGDSVLFDTGFPPLLYQFSWSQGGSGPAIYASGAGSYFYQLQDTNGCVFSSQPVVLSLDSFPAASLGPDANFCDGNQLQLDRPAGPGSAFLWSDGSSDSLLTIFTSGQYWVNATNGNGCVANDTVNVNIIGIAPAVNFSVATACVNAPVIFTDQSSTANVITQWDWDFGDGGSSVAQQPSHLFGASGLYQVNLQVTTDVGCTNDTTIAITIFPPPNASFTVSGLCERTGTAFADNSAANAGTLSSWLWDFGNLSSTGDTSSLSAPAYSYPNSGNYEVRMIVFNSPGCADTATQLISIQESPLAAFSVNKECLNDAIQFTNLSTIQLPLTNIAYRWRFTPADSSSQLNPKFTFSMPGNKPVSLRVEGSNGCFNTYNDTLSIDKFVDALFLLPQDTVCSDGMYTYTDISTSSNTTISSWAWTFDNNGSALVQDPQFAFPDPGIRNIRLVVTSSDNCTDSSKQSIVVKDPPSAAFTVSPPLGVPPFNAFFNNTSSADAVAFAWDFGNGNVSTAFSPVSNYPDTGIYTVMLVVQDHVGCRDTAAGSVTVINPSFDVVLDQVVCTAGNGFMEFVATIVNQSNIRIDEMDLYAQLNNSETIMETWSGVLEPGAVLTYIFNASMSADASTKLCCVDLGRISNAFGDSLMGQRLCVPLTSVLTVFPVFPSPATAIANLYFIAPFDADVLIRVIDISGRVATAIPFLASQGFNSLQLDVANLNSGIYTLMVYFREEAIARKFMVIR